LRRDSLADRAKHAARKGNAAGRVYRRVIALANRDELELDAGGGRLGDHARAFQEGEAWFAPAGEALQPAHDLVLRAG